MRNRNNETEENWKVIPGFSNYEVSNLGRVKSKKWNKERILRQMNNRGYKHVILAGDDGKKQTMRVHRLVAQAFVENPEHKPTVDHINNNPADNRSSNLRWATMKEQLSNPRTARKQREGNRKNALKARHFVFVYDENLTLKNTYKSTADAGRDGHSQGNVACCCKGVIKRYKGLIWSYVQLNNIQEREAIEKAAEKKREKRLDSIREAAKKYIRETNYYQTHREKFLQYAKESYLRKKSKDE